MKRIKFDRDSTIWPSAARTPPRYLLYWGVRVQNETGHKWTPRCGSPLFGRISPDRRSTAAVRLSLLYVLSFIGGAGGKEEEKRRHCRSADGVLEFTLSVSRPPPFALSFSLFANASRNKIFETRARILALAFPSRRLPLFPSINPLLPSLIPLNLYISFALFFFFPFGSISRSRIR